MLSPTVSSFPADAKEAAVYASKQHFCAHSYRWLLLIPLLNQLALPPELEPSASLITSVWLRELA